MLAVFTLFNPSIHPDVYTPSVDSILNFEAQIAQVTLAPYYLCLILPCSCNSFMT